ncbi:MAG: hypothetical protein ACI8Y7_000069 [Candidatus Woesearchaeota archaeon]|jgi:uncharacterized protein (DUF1778 family)
MELKTTRLQTLVTSEESKLISDQAKKDKRSVSGYIRRALLQDAQNG